MEIRERSLQLISHTTYCQLRLVPSVSLREKRDPGNEVVSRALN